MDKRTEKQIERVPVRQPNISETVFFFKETLIQLCTFQACCNASDHSVRRLCRIRQKKRVCESSVAWAGAFCKPAAGSREACSPSASSWRSKHSRPRYKQMPPRPSVEKSSLQMNFSFYFIKHKTTDKMLETIVYIIFVFSYRLRCQDLKKQLHPPNLTPPLTSLL